MNLPKSVKIVEVGPRDGLQNEKKTIDVHDKIALIDGLAHAGLQTIEAGSFVSAKWVPQMANTQEVYAKLDLDAGVAYPALVPNLHGLEEALRVDIKEVSCFTSVSDTFNQKNINCTVAESLERIAALVDAAKSHGLNVRAYVSCIAGCPYEGEVKQEMINTVVGELLDIGCYEISLGDTIGVATPAKIVDVIDQLNTVTSIDKLALHLHDTYGQALANVYAGLQAGIRIIDSSVAGLGGCPYAKGASGNLATEDLVYMLNGLNIETGVDLNRLITVGNSISQILGRENQSKVARASHTK